jgi:uncharacterized membrane protein
MAIAIRDPQPLARAGGLCYVVIIVCGIFAEAFVRGTIRVAGDPGTTVANLLVHETLFRTGLLADTLMLVADVAVTVLLLVLLWPAGRVLSSMAAAFHITQTAIIGANLTNLLEALLIARAGAGAASGDTVLQLFSAHAHGYSLALVFFGVNCVLLGVLIWKARYLPSWLGLLMGAAGIVYLVTSGLQFAAPSLYDRAQVLFVICLIAEAALALWLMAKGVDQERWAEAAQGMYPESTA